MVWTVEIDGIDQVVPADDGVEVAVRFTVDFGQNLLLSAGCKFDRSGAGRLTRRSRYTVQPSFSQKCSHEAFVTRLPLQLCASSCAITSTFSRSYSISSSFLYAWRIGCILTLEIKLGVANV